MKTSSFLEQQLSEHFTLRTMVATGAAIRLDIDNTPKAESIESLRQLCNDILEPLWHRFGTVRIVRAYCSAELCRVMARQQTAHTSRDHAANSQHTSGRAADIHMASVQQAQRWADYVREQHLPVSSMTVERHMGNGCCLLHISHTKSHDSHDRKE